jgi:hypothetical protein
MRFAQGQGRRGARKKTPAWGEAGVNRRMGEGLGAGTRQSGAVAQATLCKPFCSRRMRSSSVSESLFDRSVPLFAP